MTLSLVGGSDVVDGSGNVAGPVVGGGSDVVVGGGSDVVDGGGNVAGPVVGGGSDVVVGGVAVTLSMVVLM